jgi:hypothetical protein
MKKRFFTTIIIVIAVVSTTVQAQLLKFEELYETVKAEAEAGGPATLSGGTKYLLNADRTIGIFLLKSTSDRPLRIDKSNIKFTNGIESTVRLETNGAPGDTDERKIYITCSDAGRLTVGGYNENAAARGYTLEKEDGTELSAAASALPQNTDKQNIPVQTYSIEEAGTVVLNPNNGIYYGFIQFEAGVVAGLADLTATKIVESVSYYNVLGVEVSSSTKGLIIVKTVYTDGSSSSKKVYK